MAKLNWLGLPEEPMPLHPEYRVNVDSRYGLREMSAGYYGPIIHTREGGPEYPDRKPRQTDTPVQIRRARGAFIRARHEEEISGWSTLYGYGSACHSPGA